MVKDINPGAGWSNLSGITAVNRIIYFTADDGTHGAELWRSDGTARGTRMVKDINPGAGSGAPTSSPTSTAPSTSPRPRATTSASCGEATAPRRGRRGQERERLRPDRLPRRPLLRPPVLGRAVAERRHRGGNDHRQDIVIGSYDLTDVNGILYFTAGDTAPRQRAVAKRRHRGRHDDGQGLRPRELPLPPTNVNGRPLLHSVLSDPVPSRMSCGEATAPRLARPSSQQRRIFGLIVAKGGSSTSAVGRTVAKRRHAARNALVRGNPSAAASAEC